MPQVSQLPQMPHFVALLLSIEMTKYEADFHWKNFKSVQISKRTAYLHESTKNNILKKINPPGSVMARQIVMAASQ